MDQIKNKNLQHIPKMIIYNITRNGQMTEPKCVQMCNAPPFADLGFKSNNLHKKICKKMQPEHKQSPINMENNIYILEIYYVS